MVYSASRKAFTVDTSKLSGMQPDSRRRDPRAVPVSPSSHE
jgi:hypothetical protein